MDTTTAYDRTRERITDLARDLDAATGARPAPACPAWTVRDLLAHVVGVTADILAGTVDRTGSETWTARHVETRAGTDVAGLLDEWSRTGPQLVAALPDGALPDQAVFDIVTHEHDLRHAIGRPGAQDDEAVVIGLGFVGHLWPLVAGSLGVPPVRIVAGDREMVVGDAPATTLHLSPFEALRACTGRRSAAQLRAYDWGTDPTPWLPAFTWGPFSPSAVDIVETPANG